MRFTPAITGCAMALITLIFFSVAINSQDHGWLPWYRLSRTGQETRAMVARVRPEVHSKCFFTYPVNSREYETSDSGCHAQVGAAVSVTYLPADPSFATLKPPMEQLFSMVFGPLLLSALAGIAGVWQANRRQRSATS